MKVWKVLNNAALSLGVKEARDVPPIVRTRTGEVAEQQAVLPVDQNKNAAINNQVVSASVPNKTNTGIFQQYFPRGIFS